MLRLGGAARGGRSWAQHDMIDQVEEAASRSWLSPGPAFHWIRWSLSINVQSAIHSFFFFLFHWVQCIVLPPFGLKWCCKWDDRVQKICHEADDALVDITLVVLLGVMYSSAISHRMRQPSFKCVHLLSTLTTLSRYSFGTVKFAAGQSKCFNGVLRLLYGNEKRRPAPLVDPVRVQRSYQFPTCKT